MLLGTIIATGLSPSTYHLTAKEYAKNESKLMTEIVTGVR